MDALAAALTARDRMAAAAAAGVEEPAGGGEAAAASGVGEVGEEGRRLPHLDVDWRLDGTERHFTYGTPGTDVWAALFEPLSAATTHASTGGDRERITAETAAASAAPPPPHPADSPLVVGRRLNMLLCSVFRAQFSASQQRAHYHSLYRRYVHVRHPRVLAACIVGRATLRAITGGRGRGSGGCGGRCVLFGGRCD
jgi:hypothetical protein